MGSAALITPKDELAKPFTGLVGYRNQTAIRLKKKSGRR
jgi:hypothetical protein